MTTKTQNTIHSAIVAFYNHYGFNEVNYTKIEEICHKTGAINSITTGMVKSGFAIRTRRGYYKIQHIPSEDWAKKINDELSKMAKESARKRDIIKKHDSQLSQQASSELVQKITTQQAIDHLKALNYRIQKPETVINYIEI